MTRLPTCLVLTAVLVPLLGGCQTLQNLFGELRQPKIENPVVGPPPPRINVAEADVSEETEVPDGRTIMRVGLREKDLPDFEDSMVIATVNEAPIFAGELLANYRAKLIEERPKMPPEEFRKVRMFLIRQHLPQAIERKLLIVSLRNSLKPEQMKALDGHMEGRWAERVEELKKEYEVTSARELEVALEAKGVELGQLKRSFIDENTAREYLALKGQSKQEPGRPELLAYYQEHLADYETPAKVKWSQILVAVNGSEKEARQKMQRAVQELLDGAPFEDVAKSYSDGATADKGGAWDWTRAGSLADKEVEQVLFELPVGEVSEILETSRGLQVVKVLDRVEAGRTPLGDVQDEIKAAIREQEFRAQIATAVEEMKKSAVVVTVFDGPSGAEAPEEAENATNVRRRR